jgi:hypothetical protein
MAKVSATPVVRRMAARWGVELANVVGTGVGGRITPRDVRAAAQSAPSVQLPVSGPGRPPAGADPKVYARNPLLDEARAMPNGARLIANAVKNDAGVPTLFSSGDLPVFTASGIDPSALLAVPWYVRHTVAAEPSRGQAYELLERYSGPEGEVTAQLDGAGVHPGNYDYQARVTEWLMRGETAAGEQARAREWQAGVEARRRARSPQDMTPAEAYDRAFGEIDRARAERENGPQRGARIR